MTNAERVEAYLRDHPGEWLDEDELGVILDIDRHQINQLCRKLEAQQRLRRERIDGKLRNAVDYVEAT
jgi:DNA-binding GntR family transcriptional regulator